ncbi:hypothetical protein VP1G_11421 [Cytospora mali]|uniref:Uncharacterized protein n=1 Tax=Cytospora mali TaxID=578113 RepID=A0A194VG19_CYTMA|nr:hypothetical protein VP1G_11421 [Valsa mali var. pyri (nom. inval.)]
MARINNKRNNMEKTAKSEKMTNPVKTLCKASKDVALEVETKREAKRETKIRTEKLEWRR